MSWRIGERLREAAWVPPFVAYAGWATLSIAVVYAVTWLDQAQNPPSCYGIGWGCTPDPGAAAVLFLAFIVLPALVFGWGAIAVLGLLGVSRRNRLMSVNIVSVALIAALVAMITLG